MKRPLGYLSLLLAVLLAAGSWLVPRVGAFEDATIDGFALEPVFVAALWVCTVLAAGYGLYALASRLVLGHIANRRRQHDARNVLRLGFGVATTVAVLGAITQQWVGVLFSLGVVGFAVTFALQQPLFSLIGWLYIVASRPYQVGDRVAIENSKGDVVEVGFFVTTLWEIDGELVAANQPSGRIVTLPNSVVLSSHVYNYSAETFPFVWNELTVQVSYETDLEFAREALIDEADDYLGDEMAERIARYRERLAETPVELEVQDRPTVNVAQRESWVELRLRYLVHPRRGQRVRNVLYQRILARLNDHPDRVSFPIGRNR